MSGSWRKVLPAHALALRNVAGMDVPEIKAMVELYPVGQIFDNHVYPGVLHNAFIDVGAPSRTAQHSAPII